MIIVKFMGGLGNQMSQYAYYQKLKSVYPSQIIKADCSIYRKQSIHNGFELFDVFNIDSKKLPIASKFDVYRSSHKITRGRVINQQYTSGYPEDMGNYELPQDRIYYFSGTWHNCDYSNVMNVLYEDFRFIKPLSQKNSKYMKDIISADSVSIHLRRGDYVQEGLDILGKDYYIKAVDLIKQKTKTDNFDFFIFSDDEKYAKELIDFLPADKVHFISGNSSSQSYVDMQLMSYCHHNILANSTFSYWGAMLNQNPDKVVVKPKMQTKDRESWITNGWYRL